MKSLKSLKYLSLSLNFFVSVEVSFLGASKESIQLSVVLISLQQQKRDFQTSQPKNPQKISKSVFILKYFSSF